MSRPAAAVAVALMIAACSADRPSDDLRCDEPSDCFDGRECIDGYCVYDDDFVDAAVDADERCPPPCTSCTGLFDDAGGYTTCVIDCNGNGDCDSEVDCPAGMECQVNCTGTNSCDSGVDCRFATGCTVQCPGTNSCQGGVECGLGACTVSCTGTNACDNGVDCGLSCACDVTCNPGACDSSTQCTSPVCEDGANGCDPTLDPSCNTCPT